MSAPASVLPTLFASSPASLASPSALLPPFLAPFAPSSAPSPFSPSFAYIPDTFTSTCWPYPTRYPNPTAPTPRSTGKRPFSNNPMATWTGNVYSIATSSPPVPGNRIEMAGTGGARDLFRRGPPTALQSAATAIYKANSWKGSARSFHARMESRPQD